MRGWRILQPVALLGLGVGLAMGADAQTSHHRHHTESLTTPPEEENEHVVRDGETLGGVAARAKVPRVLIVEANQLKPPYALHAGQHLFLPRTRHHIVKDGETGFDIALRYGVPLAAINTANGLAPGTPLKVGQKLLIPTLLHPAGGPAPHPAEAEAQTPREEEAPAKPRPDAGAADAGVADADEAPASHSRFAWPVTGKVVRGFVARGQANHHDGIDITAEAGTAVRAAGEGKVVFAGVEPQSFGNLVVIDNQRPWQTVYGFLGRITVQRGQTVHGHERIGTVGHSGKAPRDELHFEIRKAGKPVDPQALLSASKPQAGAEDAEKTAKAKPKAKPKHTRPVAE